MATSSSYDYKSTATQIITEALELLVVGDGEALSARVTTSALRTLNLMLKSFQSRSIGLWLKKEFALFMQTATRSYSIGPTGDHCAISFAKSELSAAAAASATSVTIDATTDFGDTFDRDGIYESATPAGTVAVTLDGDLTTSGIATLSSQRKILIYSDADDSGITFGIVGTDSLGVSVTETLTGPNTTTVYSTKTYKKVSSVTPSGAGTGNVEIGQVGDHVGVELTSGTMHWTYFAAALSTTVSLVTALTSAAAVDNHVYSYTEKAERPLEIDEVRLRDNSDRERPLILVSRDEYMALSNKDSTADPNQFYYDPQRTNGVMYLWGIGSSSDRKKYIKFTGRYPIQDIDSLTNDFDVPQEWLEALAWNLAVRLAPKFGKPIDPTMGIVAASMLKEAIDFDRENASSYIQVH